MERVTGIVGVEIIEVVFKAVVWFDWIGMRRVAEDECVEVAFEITAEFVWAIIPVETGAAVPLGCWVVDAFVLELTDGEGPGLLLDDRATEIEVESERCWELKRRPVLNTEFLEAFPIEPADWGAMDMSRDV